MNQLLESMLLLSGDFYLGLANLLADGLLIPCSYFQHLNQQY